MSTVLCMYSTRAAKVTQRWIVGQDIVSLLPVASLLPVSCCRNDEDKSSVLHHICAGDLVVRREWSPHGMIRQKLIRMSFDRNQKMEPGQLTVLLLRSSD